MEPYLRKRISTGGANFRFKNKSEAMPSKRSNINSPIVFWIRVTAFLSLFTVWAFVCTYELRHGKMTVSEKCLSRLNKYNTSAAAIVFVVRMLP